MKEKSITVVRKVLLILSVNDTTKYTANAAFFFVEKCRILLSYNIPSRELKYSEKKFDTNKGLLENIRQQNVSNKTQNLTMYSLTESYPRAISANFPEKINKWSNQPQTIPNKR